MPEQLRVLLFGPVAGVDPSSGDTSYVSSLLADPPEGVVYTTYREAIEEGSIRVVGRKPWHGPISALDLFVFAISAVEQLIRRTGLSFREYTRYIQIEPSSYELVHQHLIAVRQVGSSLPAFTSAGYPLTVLYENREGWSEWHLKAALRFEGSFARLVGAAVPWLTPPRRGAMSVYTQHFVDWLVDKGVPGERLYVSSTALPDVPVVTAARTGKTIGFIGRDFLLKGGDIAVAALNDLRRRDESWNMVVATSSGAPLGSPDLDGIQMFLEPSREVILREILPRIDVLVLPTRSDCGAPYAVLEALHAGIPVVLSDNPWLDERLTGPAVRRCRPEAHDVAAAIEATVRDLEESSRAAVCLWHESFSMSHLKAVLLEGYQRAIGTSALQMESGESEPGHLQVVVVARAMDLQKNDLNAFRERHRHIIEVLARECEVRVIALRDTRDGIDETSHRAELGELGVGDVTYAARPARPTSRGMRIVDAWRALMGTEPPEVRRLGELSIRSEPDAAITIGPWLGDECRGVWKRVPSVHLHEEDLLSMPENGSQSRRGRLLRSLETVLRALGPSQPVTVTYISTRELRHVRGRFRRSAQCLYPLSLDPDGWGVPEDFPSLEGRDEVLVIGNFAEPRNAEGLEEMLEEIRRRREAGTCDLKVRLVTGSGVHRAIERFLPEPWLLYDAGFEASAEVRSIYARSWAAVVPAKRATGQKTTILQAWSQGVPVVATTAAAATVGPETALLKGAGPADLVDELLRLQGEPDTWSVMARAGMDAIRNGHWRPDLDRKLTRLVRVAASRSRVAAP